MYPPTKSKTRSANDLFNGAYAMFYAFCLFFFFFFLFFFFCCFFFFFFLLVFFFLGGGGCFFSDFLSKSICYGYSFELHRQVDAIQMGTHNICL